MVMLSRSVRLLRRLTNAARPCGIRAVFAAADVAEIFTLLVA